MEREKRRHQEATRKTGQEHTEAEKGEGRKSPRPSESPTNYLRENPLEDICQHLQATPCWVLPTSSHALVLPCHSTVLGVENRMEVLKGQRQETSTHL